MNAARISRNLTKHLLGFLSSVAAKKEKGAGAEESFGASAGIRLRGAVCRRRASWARATHPIPEGSAIVIVVVVVRIMIRYHLKKNGRKLRAGKFYRARSRQYQSRL